MFKEDEQGNVFYEEGNIYFYLKHKKQNLTPDQLCASKRKVKFHPKSNKKTIKAVEKSLLKNK